MNEETKIGRPTKFSPEVQTKILRLLSQGMPKTHVAAMVGVSYPGFMQFRHSHPDFEEEIAQAVAEGIARGLQIIQNGMNSPDQSTQIRAAAWYLEHVHPEHFARNRIEVTGKDGSPLFGEGPLLPIERLRQLIAEDKSALALIEVNPEKLLGNGQSDE